jgi:hypothetical protein
MQKVYVKQRLLPCAAPLDARWQLAAGYSSRRTAQGYSYSYMPFQKQTQGGSAVFMLLIDTAQWSPLARVLLPRCICACLTACQQVPAAQACV